MPSTELQNLVALLSVNPLGPDRSIDDQRQGIDLLGATIPLPDRVVVEPVDAGGVPAEWVRPPTLVGDRTILYLHGGGYNIGSPTSHRPSAARIAVAARAQVLLPDYRLAPEHPFPAAVDDTACVYRWLLDDATIDPAHLTIMGDSAGGGLTLAGLVAVRDDAGLPLPACAVGISPWADLALAGDSAAAEADNDPILTNAVLSHWAANYVGDDRTQPRASPLYAQLAGLCPLLLMAAEHELLRDDTVRVAQRAGDAGVDVTTEIVADAVHAWTIFAGLIPEADPAIDRIAAFIDEHT